MKMDFGNLKSANVIKRYEYNPVLSKGDVAYPSTLTYNAGVTKFRGKYVMIFRNDYYQEEPEFKFLGINLGLAFSDDGLKWNVEKKPCLWPEKLGDASIKRLYDPRLTVIDGRCYMCCAADTFHGIRGVIAVTDDFDRFEVLSMTVPDNRNMVLFPEKVNGKYFRLERPFPVYGRPSAYKESFDIWSSDSPDLMYWGNSKLVLGAETVPYCNSKIGPSAPPVKTQKGWLTTIHAVIKDETRPLNAIGTKWFKTYCAGLMLLDLNDPSRVIGFYDKPLIYPEESFDYEMRGLRGSVIFPGGMILEDSGEVKIYYGAADTVECLATAELGDLLNLFTAG